MLDKIGSDHYSNQYHIGQSIHVHTFFSLLAHRSKICCVHTHINIYIYQFNIYVYISYCKRGPAHFVAVLLATAPSSQRHSMVFFHRGNGGNPKWIYSWDLQLLYLLYLGHPLIKYGNLTWGIISISEGFSNTPCLMIKELTTFC